MKTATITILCIILLFWQNMALATDAEASEIATKITSGPDRSGDVWFAIKAKVKNVGSSKQVAVRLQAIDRQGFELIDFVLHGDIPPGESRFMTDKHYMSNSDYKKIREWRLEN